MQTMLDTMGAHGYTLNHQRQGCVRMALTKWLRTGQVAELIGVDRDTVQRYCREGKLKSTQTAGGHYRCTMADVAEFLQRMVDHAFTRAAV